MKKKIIRLLGVSIFVIVLFFNIGLGLASSNKTKTELKNLETLACYSVEQDGMYMWDCCYPWIDFCYVEYGQNFKGTITYY
jgi:hypothetical protein